jgi:exoribonuclease R
VVEPAYVLSVSEGGIVVLVPRFGIEGAISFSSTSANSTTEAYKYGINSIELDEVRHLVQLRLKSTNVPYSIQVFQAVKVKLLTEEASAGQRHLSIDLVLEN